MFYRHYFTIPAELHEQEGIIPLCRVVVHIHHGVGPVTGGNITFDVIKHNGPLAYKAFFIRRIFEGKPDKVPCHKLNSRQFTNMDHLLQKGQNTRFSCASTAAGALTTQVFTHRNTVLKSKKEKKGLNRSPNDWPKGPRPPKNPTGLKGQLYVCTSAQANQYY